MVEKLMEYATPPGTNGETEFHNVMRKMYPNPTGTQMPNANAVGTQTFNFGMPIPPYIKSKGQIAFIAFLQDDTGKEVLNANISAQVALAVDAEAVSADVPFLTCNTSVTPSFVLKNLGSQTLTSADVVIKVNGVQNSSTPWTGSLASGASAQPTLPAITGLSSGVNNIEISIANPNGQADNDGGNNLRTTVVNVPGAPGATPYTQDFQGLFPGPNSFVQNTDAGATWSAQNVGADGTNKSVRMYFYNSPPAEIDYLYLPRLDLSGAQVAFMSFFRAAAQYSNNGTLTNDQVEIQVSTNCGSSWATVWSKAGDQLATTSSTQSSFAPVAVNWYADSANLTSVVGQQDVMVRFKATSDFGNNAFFDQINIYKRAAGVGINDLTNISSLNVYPNPASDLLNIDYTMDKSEPVTINITNAVGQIVYTSFNQTPATVNNVRVDVSGLAAGFYFVNLVSESGKATYKFSAQ